MTRHTRRRHSSDVPLTREEAHVPITDIKEIRILPSLAVGRFGSSPDPMDNYEVQLDANDLTGFQKLVPAETLTVDRATGEITESVTPAAPVKFRDENGRIRPVAPFFEGSGRGSRMRGRSDH